MSFAVLPEKTLGISDGFVRAASTPVSLIFAAIVLLSDDSGILNYGIALFVIVIVDLRNPKTTSRNVAFVCVYPNKHKLICVTIRKRPPKLRTLSDLRHSSHTVMPPTSYFHRLRYFDHGAKFLNPRPTSSLP